MKLKKYYFHLLALMFATVILAGCGAVENSAATSSTSGTGSTGSTSGSIGYGTATLSWLPPTSNSDGTVLTDLSGYKIYYGTSAGNYTNVITVNNPGLASYVIDNLPTGYTYYFAITAINSQGIQSDFSAVGSKAIPA